MDRELLLGLQFVLREADRDADCQLVVIQGIDSPFCTADDIASWVQSDSNWELRLFQETLQVLETIRPVTVARDDGGFGDDGLELALACDLVLAADGPSISTPKLGWAVAPGAGNNAKLAGLCAKLPSFDTELMAALTRPPVQSSVAAPHTVGDLTADLGVLHAA